MVNSLEKLRQSNVLELCFKELCIAVQFFEPLFAHKAAVTEKEPCKVELVVIPTVQKAVTSLSMKG